jgi:hypothetical protein
MPSIAGISKSGQEGVNMLQDIDASVGASSSASSKEGSKTLNILEGKHTSNEASNASNKVESLINTEGIESAVNSRETRDIVKAENAFDRRVDKNKKIAIDSAKNRLEQKHGRESLETRDESIASNVKDITSSTGSSSSNTSSSNTSSSNTSSSNSSKMVINKATDVADFIKGRLLKNHSRISKELGMSEKEYESITSKISRESILNLSNYAKDSSGSDTIAGYNRAITELNLLFGSKAGKIQSIIFNENRIVTGARNPKEQPAVRPERVTLSNGQQVVAYIPEKRAPVIIRSERRTMLRPRVVLKTVMIPTVRTYRKAVYPQVRSTATAMGSECPTIPTINAARDAGGSSFAASTGQPGTPSTGKSGTPSTGGQPGTPSTAPAGAPSTGGQPGTPSTGPAGAPSTGGQPGTPSTGPAEAPSTAPAEAPSTGPAEAPSVGPAAQPSKTSAPI